MPIAIKQQDVQCYRTLPKSGHTMPYIKEIYVQIYPEWATSKKKIIVSDNYFKPT